MDEGVTDSGTAAFRRHHSNPLDRAWREVEAMLLHAAGQGIAVPPTLAATVCEIEPTAAQAKDVWSAHRDLSRLVAPATPQAILVLEEEAPRTALGTVLGPVRLVRQLMSFGLAMLALFVVVLAADGDTLTQISSEDPIALLAKEGTTFWAKLSTAVALLTAAGLGAAFAALYRANRFVSRGVFDPRYAASYWINIVLGLIAGFVLAQLLPANFRSLGHLGKPLLALLGGFSATAVYRILTRMVQAVESLVQQDSEDLIAQRERAIQEEASNETLQARVGLAARLVKLREQLTAGGLTEEQIRALTGEMIEELLPSSGTAGS